VPFMESTSGHSRLTMASRNRSSRLYAAHVELFQAHDQPQVPPAGSAPGWPRADPRVVGHQRAAWALAAWDTRFLSGAVAAARLACSRAALAAGSPDCFDLSPEADVFFSKCFHGAVSLNLADN
jgi:hypothetical protein